MNKVSLGLATAAFILSVVLVATQIFTIAMLSQHAKLHVIHNDNDEKIFSTLNEP